MLIINCVLILDLISTYTYIYYYSKAQKDKKNKCTYSTVQWRSHGGGKHIITLTRNALALKIKIGSIVRERYYLKPSPKYFPGYATGTRIKYHQIILLEFFRYIYI